MTRPNISLPTLNEKQIAYFWSNSKVDPVTGCHNWTGSMRGKYGRVKFDKRCIPAHRVAYFIHYGVNPKEYLVCHTCDNPICINPEHLFLGTPLDNVLDMSRKKRNKRGDNHPARTNPECLARGSRNGMNTKPEKRSKGESNGNSKLTDEKVREIRNKYIPWVVTAEQLAWEYGVAKPQILNIIHRKTWKHVL